MISGEFENGLRTVEDQLRKNGNEREEQCWNDEIARESSHCAECRKWTIAECEWTFEMNSKNINDNRQVRNFDSKMLVEYKTRLQSSESRWSVVRLTEKLYISECFSGRRIGIVRSEDLGSGNHIDWEG